MLITAWTAGLKTPLLIDLSKFMNIIQATSHPGKVLIILDKVDQMTTMGTHKGQITLNQETKVAKV